MPDPPAGTKYQSTLTNSNSKTLILMLITSASYLTPPHTFGACVVCARPPACTNEQCTPTHSNPNTNFITNTLPQTSGACGVCARCWMLADTTSTAAPLRRRYSVYLLYSYQSTNTDTWELDVFLAHFQKNRKDKKIKMLTPEELARRLPCALPTLPL